MQRVRRGTHVKGTKRMKTQLTLRVHEDVTARHERLLLHADACRQSVVRLASSAAACSSCRHSGTGSSRSRSARQCSRQRRPSLRRAVAGPQSARTSVCARFTLFSHDLRAPHRPRRVRRLEDHRVHCHAHPRLVVKSQRATMFSSKTPESEEGSGWPSVRTHLSLR